MLNCKIMLRTTRFDTTECFELTMIFYVYNVGTWIYLGITTNTCTYYYVWSFYHSFQLNNVLDLVVTTKNILRTTNNTPLFSLQTILVLLDEKMFSTSCFYANITTSVSLGFDTVHFSPCETDWRETANPFYHNAMLKMSICNHSSPFREVGYKVEVD